MERRPKDENPCYPARTDWSRGSEQGRGRVRIPGWLLLTGMVVMAGCHPRETPAEGSDPYREVILRGDDRQPIAREEVVRRMAAAEVIYLAEKHDNPHHHRLQKELLEELARRGKRPALGFEFFGWDQTGWLMNYTVGKPSPFHAEDPQQRENSLRKRLGWQHREDWPFYFNLLEVARANYLPTFGADLPAAAKVRLTRSGRAAMYGVETHLLADTGLNHPDYRQLMLTRLGQSHCGHAAPDLLDRLYDTWLARNDAMAESVVTMLAERPREPVVVILGTGHVENDMGVPERVAFLKPGTRQLNLGFQEMDPVAGPPPAPASLTVGQTTFAPSHHLLWFTPPPPGGDGADPCAGFAPPPAAEEKKQTP